MSEKTYCFDWYPGGSGQLEVIAPTDDGKPLRFRYTPPFRATLRPPFEDGQLQALTDLDVIYTQLDKIAPWFRVGMSRRAGPPGPPPVGNAEVELRKLGNMLVQFVFPPYIASELQNSDLYLEIGTDETLVDLPWELMFNGQDFLCASNYVGRFVNMSKQRFAAQQRRALVYGEELKALKILVIAVPDAKPIVNGKQVEYPVLPAAEAEMTAVAQTIAQIPHAIPTVLLNPTFQELFDALATRYHIIHFVGHAQSNPKESKASGIVLKDKILSTGQLSAMLTAQPPVFCFLNGCETTRLSSTGWTGDHGLYGLGSAILGIGSYLLGSTWPIEDNAAADFASHFYECFLNGKPLGQAAREARLKIRKVDPNDVGWASYTFYGDPRLFLRPAFAAK